MKLQNVGVALLPLWLILAPGVESSGRQPTPEELKQADKELEDSKKTDPTTYKMIVTVMQMILGSLGYGTGPFDGVLDVKTKDAIQRYQRARQLPVTGNVDTLTLGALT